MSKKWIILKTEGKGTIPSILILEKYCNNWNKYLLSFEENLGTDSLPFDNEMSAVGSLSAAISRYSENCFVVHEASIEKKGNLPTNGGRADLWVASVKDEIEIYFEAKRHRKTINTKQGLKDAFSQPEKSTSIHSLIGSGFRDRAKTTGKIHRIRQTGQYVMLLLAQLELSDEFTQTDVTDQLDQVFRETVIVRKANGATETSKKNMKDFPTIGFLFVSSIDSHTALISTMTLL